MSSAQCRQPCARRVVPTAKETFSAALAGPGVPQLVSSSGAVYAANKGTAVSIRTRHNERGGVCRGWVKTLCRCRQSHAQNRGNMHYAAFG